MCRAYLALLPLACLGDLAKSVLMTKYFLFRSSVLSLIKSFKAAVEEPPDPLDRTKRMKP